MKVRLANSSIRLGSNSFPPAFQETSWLNGFIPHSSSLILLITFILLVTSSATSGAQTRHRRGAHSTRSPDVFSPADRAIVDRAMGATCAERVSDPLASVPIDQMQSRPSLPLSDPGAVEGQHRAERLLPITRKLVASAIVELAKSYDFYSTEANRARVNAAVGRVDAVKRVNPDVDARDNASVLLRDRGAIQFGTIFLAGLRSDEAMISVLAHELTHIANGRAESLQPLFLLIARRASARTGLRIRGQRAEELSCDLVGVTAVREYIVDNASWEPKPRRLARAFEHNCVEDDTSDEDHLSPRNTIRTLFALDLKMAIEILGATPGASLVRPAFASESVDIARGRFLRSTLQCALG
jgi:hypothetical protein